MKKSKFSYQEVAEICNTLTREGKTPTIHSVRSAIGSGSPNKILAYLRQWQKEYELSATVEDDLSAEFKQAVLAECARKLSYVRERLQSQLEGRENQISEMQEILDTAEGQIDELNSELERVKKESDARMLDYEKKLSAAHEQVKLRREYADALAQKTEQQVFELREALCHMQEAKHQSELKAAALEARNSELQKQILK